MLGVANLATPVDNLATPVDNLATLEVPTWLHNNNDHVHTHTKEAIDVKGEVTSEVEASQEGQRPQRKSCWCRPE